MRLKRYLSGLKDSALRSSLASSALDGACWSVMFGLAENYMTPFALLFGASVFQISLLQGLTQLSTGGGQLLGGALVQRGDIKRSRIVTTSVKIHAVTWLIAFFGAWLTKSPIVAILCYCAGVFANNFGSPAWNSWMNDLVPKHQRGIFWAARNRMQGIVQMLAISGAGIFLYLANKKGWDVAAFGLLFVSAFIVRLGSVHFLNRQQEPHFAPSREASKMSLGRFLQELPVTSFGRFVIFCVLINFTVMMVNPIIQVYLLRGLGCNYIEYTLVTMTATIASFVFMTYWGSLSDRFGNRRILLVTSVGLPFVALLWLFFNQIWALILIQLLSGFVTSGFNLATGNYIFDATEKEKLPKTMAYFNTLFTTLGFLGSLSSGFISERLRAHAWHWGRLDSFLAVFALAALLRLLIVLFFARRIKEVRDTESNPGLSYFYLYKPFQEFTGQLYRVSRKITKEIKRQ